MPVDASIANDLFLSSAQRFITQSAKCICIKKKSAMWKIGYNGSIGGNLSM